MVSEKGLCNYPNRSTKVILRTGISEEVKRVLLDHVTLCGEPVDIESEKVISTEHGDKRQVCIHIILIM